MSKIKSLFVLCLFLIVGMASLQASEYLDVKVHIFKGDRSGITEALEAVTSSFLRPTMSATIPSKFLLAEEKSQIKRVFNLDEVNLITEAGLSFEGGNGQWKTPYKSHKFRLNGQEFFFILTPENMKYPYSSKGKDVVHTLQFRILMYEKSEDSEHALLDTQFLLPENNLAVFGFEDFKGIPYFLSFHIARLEGVPLPPPPPPPPPPAAKLKDFATQEEIEEFLKGAVEITGELKPPKMIKRVEPVYPEKARQARVEGVVILGVRTDESGRVVKVKVYKSKDPLLNDASVNAIRQWIYEPLFIDGKAREAVFMVTVNFKLRTGKNTEESVGGVVGGVIKGEALSKAPRLIKRVDPKYPEELRKQGIQGEVVLEVTTDIYGRPSKIKVTSSESSLLNPPAIDAVKQWVYEPYLKDGKPIPVKFTVNVRFRLR
ncbi:energy transducer TonB [Acidobacteriota bacterium]